MDIWYLLISLIITSVLFVIVSAAVAIHSRHTDKRFKKMEHRDMRTAAKISKIESYTKNTIGSFKRSSKNMIENANSKTKSDLLKKLDSESQNYRKFAESVMIRSRKQHLEELKAHKKEQKELVAALKKEMRTEIKKLEKQKQSLKKQLEKHRKSSAKKVDDLKKRIAKAREAAYKTSKVLRKGVKKAARAKKK